MDKDFSPAKASLNTDSPTTNQLPYTPWQDEILEDLEAEVRRVAHELESYRKNYIYHKLQYMRKQYGFTA